MGLRSIRTVGDEILGKKCKPVKAMTERTRELLGDMFETMYEADGVGLAAPQVGILQRIFVIDIGDGVQRVFINPQIVEQSEETELGAEGCLSVPGKQGEVARPVRLVVEAQDEHFEPFRLEAEGFLARAICHEYDHLEGRLYTSLVTGELYDVSRSEQDDEDEA